MELRKQSAWSETQPEFFFWRTAAGQEVDIVLEDSGGRLVGIEIKASATLGGGDVRGLQALANAAGKRWVRGVVLYAGTEIIPERSQPIAWAVFHPKNDPCYGLQEATPFSSNRID